MDDNKQEQLIDNKDLPPTSPPTLSPSASLQAALGLFEIHMRDEGFSINTVKAFASDIRLLGKFWGIGQPVGEIGTKDLNDYMKWIENGRDANISCSPKTYARRVTTIKVFFSWLHKTSVLAENPSDAVIQHSVRTPLPTLPTEEDIKKALAVTTAVYEGSENEKSDTRPHMLLTLLLQTGIKKSETMAIIPNHIDDDDASEPILFIRYANPRLRYKERKLYLEPEWIAVFDAYLQQYKPTDTLFTCTARNLEYVLSDVSEAAGLVKGSLSFENLRWISALRDWNAEVEPDEIRQKLGLSKITWRETQSKLKKLTTGQIIDNG